MAFSFLPSTLGEYLLLVCKTGSFFKGDLQNIKSDTQSFRS